MALNITIHSPQKTRNGAMPGAARLEIGTAGIVCALGAQSAAFQGPCLLCLIADEGQRFDLTRTPGYVAPSASGKKLLGNIERWYDISDAGTYYINTVLG